MKRIEMALNNIDNLIGEIGKLIEQFKSYETIASETLEASNELIEILREDSKLGEKEGGSRYSGDNENEEKSSGNIFAESVNIFSSSVNTFQNAVNSFVNGVSKGQATQQKAQSSGGGINMGDVGAIAGVAAAGYGAYKLLGALGGIFGGGKGGSSGGSGGWGINPLKEISQIEQEVVNLRKQFHFSDQAMQGIALSINEASVATRTWGVSTTALMEEMGKLSTATGRTRILSMEDTKTLGAFQAVMKGEATVFLDAMDKMGISIEGSKEKFQEMRKTSGEWGVDAKQHMENIYKNIRFANQFHFKEGINGLSKMAAHALRMRMDMGQIESYAKNFDLLNIEGAITKSAEMQVLGGPFAQHSNPFANMYNSLMDPEAIIKQHADMGKQMFHFDAKKGMTVNSAESLLAIRKYAEIMGMNPSDMMNTMRRGASEGIISNELLKNQQGLSEYQKNTVKGKAEYMDLGGGRMGWGVSVKDAVSGDMVNKAIDQLTAEDMKAIQATSETSLFEVATNTRTMVQLLQGSTQGLLTKGLNYVLKQLPNVYGRGRGFGETLASGTAGTSGGDFGEALGVVKDTAVDIGGQIKSTLNDGWGYLRETVFPMVGKIFDVVKEWWKEADIGGTLKGWWDTAWEGVKSWWNNEDNSIRSGLEGLLDKITGWWMGTAWPAIKYTFAEFFGWIPGVKRKDELLKDDLEKELLELKKDPDKNKDKISEVEGRLKNMGEGENWLQQTKRFLDRGTVGILSEASALIAGAGGAILDASAGTSNLFNRLIGSDKRYYTGYTGDAWNATRDFGYGFMPASNKEMSDARYERGKVKDGMILSSGNIVKFDSADDIIAAKPGGALGSLLNNAGISSRSGGGNGGNLYHSGGININFSGTIQLQDPNGHIHNWEGLTRNTQFISQITDKISLEITKKINHGKPDGQLIYGGYRPGMFG